MPSRTTDANLDFALFENALYSHRSLMVRSQPNKIELVTRPNWCPPPERGEEDGGGEAPVGSDVALCQPGFEQGRDQAAGAFGGGEFQPGPPAHDVFRPLRQNIYAVLFNLHHARFTKKSNDEAGTDAILIPAFLNL